MRPKEIMRFCTQYFLITDNWELWDRYHPDRKDTPGRSLKVLQDVGWATPGTIATARLTPEGETAIYGTPEEREARRMEAEAREAQEAEAKAQKRETRARRIISNNGEGKWCVVCGKELFDDASKRRGIGPDCFKRVLEQFPDIDPHDTTAILTALFRSWGWIRDTG